MNRYGKGLGSGWHFDSHRHSLARLGVKTGRKSTSGLGLGQAFPKRLDFAHSSSPQLMDKFQDFVSVKIDGAVENQPEHIQSHPEVAEMRKDIPKISNFQKFKAWTAKHKNAIALIGLGGLIAVATQSGLGTLMQNTATGEIVAVGRTWLGQTGIMAETALTGFGVGEEFKVISHDISEKQRQEMASNPEDFRTGNKVLVYNVNPKHISYARKNAYFHGDETTDLAKLSSNPIPYSKLTSEEKRNLNIAKRKVKHLFKEHGKNVNLNGVQIVDRVGPDDSAWGGHQGNLIQLQRDILKNPEKTDGVLCLVEGTSIPCEKLYKNIEDVVVDDRVLGRDGKFHCVEKVFSRVVDEEIIVIRPKSMLPIEMTAEHPLLVSKFIPLNETTGRENRALSKQFNINNVEWINAEDVRKNDMIMIPILNNLLECDSMDLKHYHVKMGHNKVMLDKFPINKETAYMLGLFVAEGSVIANNKCVQFSFNNMKERHMIPMLQMIFDTNFNLCVKERVRDNSLTLSVCNSILGRFLKDVCNGVQKTRQIPSFILYNKNIEILKSFITGYMFGDGFYYKEKRQQQCATISKNLALQLQLAYTRMNIVPNIYLYHRDSGYDHKFFGKGNGTEINNYQMIVHDKKQNKQVSILYNDKYLFVKVADIYKKKYKGSVYNIQTDKNTYVANNIIVHNCHEQVHKVYDVRDETRDLENIDIDMIGTLMNQDNKL